MLVIVDADALVALADPLHKHRPRVEVIVKKLAKRKAYSIYPTTAICEAVTVLQRKLKKPKSANDIIQFVKAGRFKLHPIDREIILEAIEKFDPFGQEKNTLFDSIIAAIAIRYKADAIFSFDGWYEDIKLKLVEQALLEEGI